MDILSLIEQICVNLKNGRFSNEASVSQGILLPILQRLEWPVFDTSIVIPEYTIGGRRVDYALCDRIDHPVIFIEVKKTGQAEGADKQLFEYAFHKGIQLALLTDGREWHFYLPGEEGEYHERRVYKLDIIERDPNDAAKILERYLQFKRVCSGMALQAAREDYKTVSRQRKIKKTLTRAWSRLLEEKDEILLELLADKVEDLCGYKPDYDVCSSFISEGVMRQPAIERSKSRSTPSEPQIRGTAPTTEKQGKDPQVKSYTLSQLANENFSKIKPAYIEIEKSKFENKNWSDLCVKFVTWLVQNHYLTHSNIPIYNYSHRNKYFVNLKAEHADPNKAGYWKQVKEFYIDTQYSTKAHVKNLISTLQQLNIDSLDVKISFIL
ncbi:hypothetical protein IIA28_13120 [candidate division KSB1 bacterium]|nr:hypothetical protein [candidate division KSB1 bacterium]